MNADFIIKIVILFFIVSPMFAFALYRNKKTKQEGTAIRALSWLGLTTFVAIIMGRMLMFYLIKS